MALDTARVGRVRMEGTTRINLVVGADIPDKLSELAGSGRKRGEYVTQLVRAIHSGQQDIFTDDDGNQPKLNLAQMLSKQEELEGRVRKLEEQIAETRTKHG